MSASSPIPRFSLNDTYLWQFRKTPELSLSQICHIHHTPRQGDSLAILGPHARILLIDTLILVVLVLIATIVAAGSRS